MTPEELAEIERLSSMIPKEEDDDVLRLPEPPVPPVKKARKPRAHAHNVKDTFQVHSDREPSHARPRLSWPFKNMRVGDWFPVNKEENHQRARVASNAYAKRNQRKFTCKKNAEGVLIVKRVL